MRRIREYLKAGDLILCVLIALAAVAVFAAFAFGGRNAVSVTVKSDSGTANYPLSEDAEIGIDSNGHKLVLVISGGKAFVSSSDCPDKVCVSTPAISEKGGTIICVPARVEIKADGGDSDDGIDWTVP